MNIFTIIHLLFIVYVLAVPLFSKCHQTLFLHISILFLLLLHWITNNDVCVDGNRTVLLSQQRTSRIIHESLDWFGVQNKQ